MSVDVSTCMCDCVSVYVCMSTTLMLNKLSDSRVCVQ